MPGGCLLKDCSSSGSSSIGSLIDYKNIDMNLRDRLLDLRQVGDRLRGLPSLEELLLSGGFCFSSFSSACRLSNLLFISLTSFICCSNDMTIEKPHILISLAELRKWPKRVARGGHVVSGRMGGPKVMNLVMKLQISY